MTPTAELTVRGLQSRDSLSAAEREDMFALLARHFEGVTREQFARDLEEKNWVIQIRREGRLLGFSTLLVRDDEGEATPLTVIYSGDTIVAPEAWGSPALARTWIAAVNSLRSASPGRACYWLLLTSGFRTYRLLPLFWREFYPRFDRATPAHLQKLLDRLARAQYGSSFNPAAGIVRFSHPQRLRAALARVPTGRTLDPHVAFFLARNPGHIAGEELACLVEIGEANLTLAGRRMVAPASR